MGLGFDLRRTSRLTVAALATGLLANGLAALAHEGHRHPHAATAEAPPATVRTQAQVVLPAVTLVSGAGQAARLAEWLATSDPVLLNFIYTDCTTVCPLQSQVFAQVQEQLRQTGRRVRMVSISIDPLHDTPPRLDAYARRFGAGDRWHFLTGTPQASVAVQRAFGTWRGDKMNHPLVTFVRLGSDRPWVRLEGPATAHDLLRELQPHQP